MCENTDYQRWARTIVPPPEWVVSERSGAAVENANRYRAVARLTGHERPLSTPEFAFRRGEAALIDVMVRDGREPPPWLRGWR
jgi:hypothetical protein